MKSVYLTFDIETIVSGLSKSDNYIAGVYLGSMYIAEQLRIRNQKGTFFISLSSKQSAINQGKYLDCIKWLVQSLESYDNIRIAPHLHAYRLPMQFPCTTDDFGSYSESQQIDMLGYSREFFHELGIDCDSFRPGGFKRNEHYYNALKKAGFKYSSTLIKDNVATVDLINNKHQNLQPYYSSNGIKEYPVTSVRLKSIKGKIELVNLSPDFMSISSVAEQLMPLEYINVNFHSFSVYLNRLTRENHKGQLCNNIKFLFFEKVLNKILNKTSLQTINTNTIVKNSLVDWLDFFYNHQVKTKFIGE